MSKYKKAFAALMFMILIWVAFFLLLWLFKIADIGGLLDYKGEVDIFIQRNDQGTEMLTILSASKNGISNMVALGSSAAKNLPRDLDDQAKASLDAMARAKETKEYYLNVWDGSTLLKSFGSKTSVKGTSKSALTADIIDRFFTSRQSPLQGLGQCIMEEAERTGVPAAVIMSVAAHESNWGKSDLANGYCPTSDPYKNPSQKLSNNLFGYKGTGTNGYCKWRTWECSAAAPSGSLGECTNPCSTGEKCYYVADDFRSYYNKCESVIDFVELISGGKRYQNAMKYASQPETMIAEILKAGYATDPNWTDGVLSIMRSFTAEYPYVAIPSQGSYAEIPLPNGGRGRIEMVV